MKCHNRAEHSCMYGPDNWAMVEKIKEARSTHPCLALWPSSKNKLHFLLRSALKVMLLRNWQAHMFLCFDPQSSFIMMNHSTCLCFGVVIVTAVWVFLLSNWVNIFTIFKLLENPKCLSPSATVLLKEWEVFKYHDSTLQ